MAECLALTSEQLQNLLASGWTKLGGPYGTQDQCLNNCGGGSSSSSSASSSSSSSSSGSGGTVTVDCCENALPTTLYASIGTVTGFCAFPSNVTLTWNPDIVSWESECIDISGSCYTRLRLLCTPGFFFLSDACANILLSSSFTCDPFEVTFNSFSTFGGTGGPGDCEIVCNNCCESVIDSVVITF